MRPIFSVTQFAGGARGVKRGAKASSSRRLMRSWSQTPQSWQPETRHVAGYLPAGAAALPELPHVKTRVEKDRTRVDIVYPIASAASKRLSSASRRPRATWTGG